MAYILYAKSPLNGIGIIHFELCATKLISQDPSGLSSSSNPKKCFNFTFTVGIVKLYDENLRVDDSYMYLYIFIYIYMYLYTRKSLQNGQHSPVVIN